MDVVELIKLLLPILGNAIGVFSGILVTNKMTDYRLTLIEQKIDGIPEKTVSLTEQVNGLKDDVDLLKDIIIKN